MSVMCAYLKTMPLQQVFKKESSNCVLINRRFDYYKLVIGKSIQNT